MWLREPRPGLLARSRSRILRLPTHWPCPWESLFLKLPSGTIANVPSVSLRKLIQTCHRFKNKSTFYTSHPVSQFLATLQKAATGRTSPPHTVTTTGITSPGGECHPTWGDQETMLSRAAPVGVAAGDRHTSEDRRRFLAAWEMSLTPPVFRELPKHSLCSPPLS